MHVPVKDLPQILQDTLKNLCDYHKKDIALTASETVSPQVSGRQGNRGYFIAVNLETKDVQVNWGSWGGGSVSPTRVDVDSSLYPIPPNVVVISGEIGYQPFATLIALPQTLAPILPPAPTISDKDRAILDIYGGIISAYRKQYLADAKATDQDIDSLINRGYLKRNAAGSVQITTAGKNARSRR